MNRLPMTLDAPGLLHGIRRRDLIGLAALGSALGPVPAAEPWRPVKPMQIIVAGTPGGVPDLLARRLAEHLKSELGQSVTVENRPGASGLIGAEAVRRAPADGHTLTVCFLGPMGLLPAFTPPPKEESGAEGFDAVGLLGLASAVVVTSSANKWKDLEQFAAEARANTSWVPTFGSPGSGTVLRLYGEMIAAATGRKMVHIGYKGVAPVVTDVIAGNLSFAVATLPIAVPLIAAGRLKALATTSGHTVPELKDIRTLSAQGFGELDIQAWYGVWAAAGTPLPALSALNASVARFVAMPSVDKLLNQYGLAATEVLSPPEMRQRLERDMVIWKKAVRALHLKLDG